MNRREIKKAVLSGLSNSVKQSLEVYDVVTVLGLGHGSGREIAFSSTDQYLGFLNNIIGYKFLLRLSIGGASFAFSLFIDYNSAQKPHPVNQCQIFHFDLISSNSQTTFGKKKKAKRISIVCNNSFKIVWGLGEGKGFLFNVLYWDAGCQCSV